MHLRAITSCDNVSISSASGGYRNPIDYGETKLDWLDSKSTLEARINHLKFATAYLQYIEQLGPEFTAECRVDFKGKSVENAIQELEAATKTKIPREVIKPKNTKISISASDTPSKILLKIIDLSGMDPSFRDGPLVLSPPQERAQ